MRIEKFFQVNEEPRTVHRGDGPLVKH